MPEGLNKLEALLMDEDFREFVAEYKSIPTASAEQWADYIIGIFEVKSWLHGIIVFYLKTGKIDPSLAADPIQIESSGDDLPGDIKLLVPSDITLPIMKRYLDRNWSTKIKPKLIPQASRRQTVPAFPKRDQLIFQDYESKSLTGLNATGIALKHNVSVSTVYRVVSRKKKSS